MKIDMDLQILPIGNIDENILRNLKIGLGNIFSKVEVLTHIQIIQSAYNPTRGQYLSDKFLNQVKKERGTQILGITEVDLYTPDLNFVFGQAELPGRAAIISIHRLHSSKPELFKSRIIKEAVHELGHTMGLRHCPNIYCVMHFSNSLMDTDIKSETYCDKCEKLLKNITIDVSKDDSPNSS